MTNDLIERAETILEHTHKDQENGVTIKIGWYRLTEKPHPLDALPTSLED
jgi:hypothetical protein